MQDLNLTTILRRYSLGYAKMSFAVSTPTFDTTSTRLDSQREVRVHDGEVYNLVTIFPHRYTPRDLEEPILQQLSHQPLLRNSAEHAIWVGVINDAIPQKATVRTATPLSAVPTLEYNHNCHGGFQGEIHLLNGHHRIAALQRATVHLYTSVVKAWKAVDKLEEEGEDAEEWESERHHAIELTRRYSERCTWLVRVIDIGAYLDHTHKEPVKACSF
jgi:hypothetical protein